MRDFALPFRVSIEQGIHHDGAAGVGEQLAAQANQSAASDAEFYAYTAVSMIVHVDDLSFAGAELFHDHANKFFGNIDGEFFHRLHQFAADTFGDDFRLADHQFETFAAHHLNKNGELQFAAAHDGESVRGAGVFNAQ